MGGRKSFLKRFFSSRIFLVLLLILAIFFVVGFAKTFWRDYQIRQEINALRQEKERWEKNKINLLNRLQEIKSPDFAEREARLKFGLGKSNESLVIIMDDQNPVTTSAGKTAKKESGPASKAIKWWQYFFE